MSFPFYLAMTCQEYDSVPVKPEHIAWMACHFSPYGTGITNLPEDLPAGSMIILNDRTPIFGHDPKRILHQLEACIQKQNPSRILLDLQCPGNEETAALVQVLTEGLPSPVGVSDIYAGEYNCPVFLPPPPPDMLLADYIAPWAGREIWLEAAPEALLIQIDECGATLHPTVPKETGKTDKSLHCHYDISIQKESASFTLWRTQEDVHELLRSAADLGVTLAIGLYQQWKS